MRNKNSDQADVDTYCDITGFTRSNGDKPKTESICKTLNENLVSFEEISKNIDMDGHTVTNLGHPVEEQSLATRGYTMNHILVNSIDPLEFQSGIIAVNLLGDGLTTIGLNEISNKASMILIL